MLRLYNQSIYLRDMKQEDIKDYMTWNTIETEWREWGMPGEKDGEVNLIELSESLRKRIASINYHTRTRFEICSKSHQHIGWVNSYYIEGDKQKLAVGIFIPNKKLRGIGVGELAYSLFIKYLMNTDEQVPIYTETWEGNDRMIRLAKKCCFELVEKEKNSVEIQGKMHDTLIFKLNQQAFETRYRDVEIRPELS